MTGGRGGGGGEGRKRARKKKSKGRREGEEDEGYIYIADCTTYFQDGLELQLTEDSLAASNSLLRVAISVFRVVISASIVYARHIHNL